MFLAGRNWYPRECRARDLPTVGNTLTRNSGMAFGSAYVGTALIPWGIKLHERLASIKGMKTEPPQREALPSTLAPVACTD